MPAPGTDFDRKNAFRIHAFIILNQRSMFFIPETFERIFYISRTSKTPRLGLKLHKCYRKKNHLDLALLSRPIDNFLRAQHEAHDSHAYT